MDVLKELENWYCGQCNEDWEHSYGVKIGTLDNPGWWVNIDLTETELEDRAFDDVVVERSDNDWVDCKVTEQAFMGNGGPRNLEEILKLFTTWASS